MTQDEVIVQNSIQRPPNMKFLNLNQRTMRRNIDGHNKTKSMTTRVRPT